MQISLLYSTIYCTEEDINHKLHMKYCWNSGFVNLSSIEEATANEKLGCTGTCCSEQEQEKWSIGQHDGRLATYCSGVEISHQHIDHIQPTFSPRVPVHVRGGGDFI
jgi:hypothetical protein